MLPLATRREASTGVDAPPYVRHRPERALLYQPVAEYYPAFDELEAGSLEQLLGASIASAPAGCRRNPVLPAPWSFCRAGGTGADAPWARQDMMSAYHQRVQTRGRTRMDDCTCRTGRILMAVIEHEVEIRASPPAVFSLVSRVEEFVHYSEAIETITRVDDNRYRWTVRAAGIPLSFDVEITESVPPERFAWRSVTGVRNRGTYRLIPVDGGTRIHLYLEYDLENALIEEAVRKAGKPLISQLSREIIRNVETRLRSFPMDADQGSERISD
jgi:uncharacterized membrane protein